MSFTVDEDGVITMTCAVVRPEIEDRIRATPGLVTGQCRCWTRAESLRLSLRVLLIGKPLKVKSPAARYLAVGIVPVRIAPCIKTERHQTLDASLSRVTAASN